MLEILLLVYLCKKMGKMLRNKGWKPLFMQIMVVVGWLTSMFAASFLYALYIAFTQGVEAVDQIGFSVYPWALLGAALSQGVLFGIARLLSDRTKPPAIDFTQPQEKTM